SRTSPLHRCQGGRQGGSPGRRAETRRAARDQAAPAIVQVPLDYPPWRPDVQGERPAERAPAAPYRGCSRALGNFLKSSRDRNESKSLSFLSCSTWAEPLK